MCRGNGHKLNNRSAQNNRNKLSRFLQFFQRNIAVPIDQHRRARMTFPLLLSIGLSCSLHAQFLTADEPAGGIRVNQIGYAPHSTKIAIMDSYLFPGQHKFPFYIIALNQFADTVFRGELQPTQADLYAKKVNYLADFSKLSREGHYYLSIPGQGTSYPFIIQQNPFDAVLKAAVKAYYYNRASTDLTARYAGRWARKAGHPDTTVYIHSSVASAAHGKGNTLSAPGGWYDAGDYNKYIVNSGITVSTLLEALTDYPSVFASLDLGIPESDDGLPDLLNEILYNLRWMLKMQDPADGGVYHKLTSANFDGMEMPQSDQAKRYVIQKTTAAALDFAAATSSAARSLTSYSNKLPGLADSLQQAAVKAWDWAKAHPLVIYDQDAMNKKNRPKITTGAYGDKNLQDEWYQTAVSLLLLTKDKRYLSVIAHDAPEHLNIPSWSDVGAVGAIWLSKATAKDFENIQGWSAKDHHILTAVQQSAKAAVLRLADRLTQQTNPGFSTVMGGRATDFTWGSNSNAANQGWILMTAYLLTHKSIYRDAALGNLDYLLGRNATGYCFVTGFGSLSPLHPHHRVSIADDIEDPIPGFLVGGPNPGRQDGVKGYSSERADLSYIDNDQAYSVNEVAINWNAPWVYLLAAITAAEKNEIE